MKTLDRLPTKADANANGLVATCYRDEWDCFSRFEKWCDVCAVENLYWHRLLKAPEVENDNRDEANTLLNILYEHLENGALDYMEDGTLDALDMAIVIMNS